MEEKKGKLHNTEQELEDYINMQISGSLRESPLGPREHVPRAPEQSTQFDTNPPKWSEIKQVVEQARPASAAGPTGIPYKVYKNCPMVLKLLWKMTGAAWKSKAIPPAWNKAVTTFIPKDKESHNISQFRGIALLNVEGKIFFSVMAKQMTSCHLAKNYIDTSCQKTGVPGFLGCIELSAMIWEQIQSAKYSKLDLHVVWLDLANAYGSVPHELISFALDFFHVHASIRSLMNVYFDNFHVCYTSMDIATGWHRLEKGIAMGLGPSPPSFSQ